MPQHKPVPHYACFRCLRSLGYGYDRTARHFGVSRKRVVKWFKYHKIKIIKPKTRYINIVPRPIIPRKPRAPKQRIDWVARAIASKGRREIVARLRSRMWQWFRQGLYPKWAPKLVGCTRQEFMDYIMSKLKDGMTMENYGEHWHLDHIKPCKAFDLTIESQRLECFHYSNYQPLTKKENLRKAARY